MSHDSETPTSGPPVGGEMGIRCGLKSMDLIEKTNHDEDEEEIDYMSYEPSEELVQQSLLISDTGTDDDS